MMTCPKCAHRIDDETCITDQATKKPKPGDLSVCMYCATALVFGRNLERLIATADDMAKLDVDSLLMLTRAQRAIMERLGEL